MNILTARLIQKRDDIIGSYGGPSENGKYFGWIMLGEKDNHRPVLNTDPVYDSVNEAEESMQKVLNLIRATDFTFTKIDPDFTAEMDKLIKDSHCYAYDGFGLFVPDDQNG